MLCCGAQQIDITPPVGTKMGGYGAREGNSAGIHDPLYAQALYLSDADSEILLIGLDLLAVDADFTQQLRSEITNLTGIAPDGILVACTHTHSGPDGFASLFSRQNQAQFAQLRAHTIQKVAGAALWAKNDAQQDASVSFWREKIDGVGTNRNDTSYPNDADLSLIRIDVAGKPYALIAHYGCHPTVMGADNLLISADLPGSARKYLHKLYPDVVTLYFNGGAGDVSTRFTRRDQGFAELDRFGQIVFGGMLTAMHKALPLDVNRLRSIMRLVRLPVRDLPSVEEAHKILHEYEDHYHQVKQSQVPAGQVRVAETKVQGARRQVTLASLLEDTQAVTTEIQAISIGELVLVSIPGEPYAEIGLTLKADFPGRPVLMVSYANDYQGYFPMGTSGETYETLKSPWAPDIGRSLVASMEHIIHELID